MNPKSPIALPHNNALMSKYEVSLAKASNVSAIQHSHAKRRDIDRLKTEHKDQYPSLN